MNKMIKGSAAGATGIVLLMGGFGTYALWSDSTDVNNGTLQSGALEITGTGAATWTDVSSTGAVGGAAVTPASQYMVPGDTWTMKQPVTIDASGKNLKVKFTVTGIDQSVDSWTNLGVTMKYDGTTLAPVTGHAYEYTYSAPAGESLNGMKDLVVSFDFPSSVTDTTDQNKSLDLSAVGVAVAQVRP